MTPGAVEQHYNRRDDLGEVILDALRGAGRDVDNLHPDGLALVDEFHVRGREATEELAALAELSPDQRVLDVGSGIGGPARRLASDHGVRVTGVDLTPEYCEIANMLSERTGLADRVEFRQADALDLPFDDGAFDVVWTQHAAMNIEDKPRLYGEIARVLRPGGRLVAYDVVAGPEGDLHFPLPWAWSPDISFLVTPDELPELIEAAGLSVKVKRDVTAAGLEWLKERSRMAATESVPIGPILLFGDEAPRIMANLVRNLDEDRLALVQIVAER